MSGVSLRSAINAKCRDCGGQEGGERHWRLHTSVCPVTACPLWRVRPLASRNVPDWLAGRDPAALPPGFGLLSHADAIARIRGAEGVLQAETGDNSVPAMLPGQPEGGGL